MRLFIAVEVSDAVRAQMRHVRSVVEQRLLHARGRPRLTWVSPGVAHCTIQFLGEVDEPLAGEIRHGLELPLPLAPFEATWDHAGVFPARGAARTIWLGASGGADRLVALAALVGERIAPFGVALEERPFRPHLTVARVRDRAPHLDWRGLLERAVPQSATSRVDHVTLYQSKLSAAGPTYTALASASLAPPS